MRVGVTGIFASGKGTVCSMFGELGAEVIDTDLLAREIMEPGSRVLSQLESIFGKNFIDSDGFLKRRELANFVFKNEDLVDKLNSITHPAILDLVDKRSSGSGIYMVNTPLLFEAGFDKYMDCNIVVTASVDQVIDRGMQRDSISGDEIKERLDHQIPLNEKIKLADYVIDNSGSLEHTKRQVMDIWKILNQNRQE
jgi:dephospho-CoA kinase